MCEVGLLVGRGDTVVMEGAVVMMLVRKVVCNIYRRWT